MLRPLYTLQHLEPDKVVCRSKSLRKVALCENNCNRHNRSKIPAAAKYFARRRNEEKTNCNGYILIHILN
jgi:hypothetical protein